MHTTSSRETKGNVKSRGTFRISVAAVNLEFGPTGWGQTDGGNARMKGTSAEAGVRFCWPIPPRYPWADLRTLASSFLPFRSKAQGFFPHSGLMPLPLLHYFFLNMDKEKHYYLLSWLWTMHLVLNERQFVCPSVIRNTVNLIWTVLSVMFLCNNPVSGLVLFGFLFFKHIQFWPSFLDIECNSHFFPNLKLELLLLDLF